MINACIKLTFLYAITALSTTAMADTSFNQDLRQGCAKVQQYAKQGQQYYDQKAYAKAIESFKQQAAWTDFCLANQDESGTNFKPRDLVIAHNNVGLSYAKNGQPLWARAWFLRDATSSISRYNLKQLKQPAPSQSIIGTYVQPNNFGQWNYIRVSQQKGAYQIKFEGYAFGSRSLIYGPNLGNFSVKMPLEQRKASYQYNNCQVTLSFEQDKTLGKVIRAKQNPLDANCGFGHGVSANGQYQKVESD